MPTIHRFRTSVREIECYIAIDIWVIATQIFIYDFNVPFRSSSHMEIDMMLPQSCRTSPSRFVLLTRDAKYKLDRS